MTVYAGVLWISDLTVPDPTLLFPLTVGLVFATNIFLTKKKVSSVPLTPTGGGGWAKAKGLWIYFAYGIAVLMFPLTAVQPAGVALYWTTSGLVGTLINLILLSPNYRRLVKIPPTQFDSKTPYLDVKDNFKELVTRWKK